MPVVNSNGQNTTGYLSKTERAYQYMPIYEMIILAFANEMSVGEFDDGPGMGVVCRSCVAKF